MENTQAREIIGVNSKLRAMILPAIIAAVGAIQAGCTKQIHQINVIIPEGHAAVVAPSAPVEQHGIATYVGQGFNNDEILEWIGKHCVRESSYVQGQTYSGTYICDDGTTRVVELDCKEDWIVRPGDAECPTGGWRSIFRIK